MAPLPLTRAQRGCLLANGRAGAAAAAAEAEHDPKPCIKIFTPDAGATWLLTEIDPEDQDRAFGLCDLGLGSPELGYVSLSEIAGLKGRMGLPVEIDRHFRAQHPISRYAEIARMAGRIVTK